MKRKVLIIMMFVSVVLSVSAQEKLFGFNAGATFGWFSGTNWDTYISSTEKLYNIKIDQKIATNINFGLVFENMFTKTFGIKLGLNYTTVGQDYSYKYAGYTIDGEYRQKIIEIPFLLKISTNGCSGLYGIIGPSVNFLFDDLEYQETVSGKTIKGSQKPDNRIVIGINGGIGYGTKIMDGIFGVEIKGGRNLTDAFDSEKKPFEINQIVIDISYGFLL